MNKKKGLKVIIIVIMSCILMDVAASTYYSIKQRVLQKASVERRENYKSDIMRFPIKINKGEYKVIDYGKNYLLDKEDNGLESFEKLATLSYIDEVNTKYSEYIITRDTTYVCVDLENIESYMEYIEYPVPISNDNLNNLRSFMSEIKDESIVVIPFNDGIHCFINGESEQYIFNIETGQVLWTRGSYYESPDFDPIKDTLTCGGDLSTTSYIFNKYGELIKTREYGLTKGHVLVFTLNIIAAFSVLLIIQKVINFNSKSLIIKVITNILLVPVMMFFIVIILWLIIVLI